MSDNKVTISVLGKLNEAETKATIIGQLNDIGKVTDIKFGVDNTNLIKTLEESRAKAVEMQKAYSGIADVSKLTYKLNADELTLQEKIVIDKNKVLNITHDLLDAEKTILVETDKTVENDKKALASKEKELVLAKKEYDYAVYLNKEYDKQVQLAKGKEQDSASLINYEYDKKALAVKEKEYDLAVLMNHEYDKQTASLIESGRVKSQLSKIKTDSAEELAQNKAINKSLEEKWILESKNAEAATKATVKMNKERKASDSYYWDERFKNQLRDRTTTNSTLKEMSAYYSIQEKDSDALIAKKAKLIKQIEIEKAKTDRLVESSADVANVKVRNQIEQYADKMKKLSVNSSMTAEQVERVDLEFKKLKATAPKVTKKVESLGSMMKTAFSKFAIWMSATSIFFGTVQAIKSGIEAVTELDTALVEFRKVTNLSTDDMEKFVDGVKDAREEVARTSAELIQASSAFARMGFSAEKSLDLGKQAAMLVNIGDGIETVDEASEAIIATLKGFNLEASASVDILDKLNEVSNTYAVDTEDLATGISKTSASMAAAGNDLDEMLALLTSATEVIQDASRASTALRTISMRLRGVSEDGEDLTSLTPELQKYFDAYGTNVSLIDEATGAFRSTYDILNDLSASWATLTDMERANLTELIAGNELALNVQKCA